MATPAQRNRPRDGSGKFRRGLANVERDAHACKLASQGWTYSAIAIELGYSDKGAAHRAVQRLLWETARSQGSEELRTQQVAELAELRRKMWEILNDPPAVVDRFGNVVYTEDAEGNRVPVADATVQVNAASAIIRANERLSRLRGLDAPKRTVSLSATLAAASPQDIEQAIAELRMRQAVEKIAGGRELDDGDRTALQPGRILPGAAESA